MQLGHAEPGDTEEYFSTIPFDKVFHEGGIGNDRTIIEHRCAEVLATSPMPLVNTLQWIYCRTAAERETLLFMLGDKKSQWSSRIVISDDLLVFERKYVFVDSVTMSPNGLVFQLNPRVDQKKIHMKAEAWDKDGKQVINFLNPELDAQPPPAQGKRWRVPANLPNGNYLVHIDLEGHLAYRGTLALGPRLV